MTTHPDPHACITEIEARLEAATPGPWARDQYNQPDMQVIARGNEVICFHRKHERQIGARVVPNHELMAHAPADLRWAITALTAALARAERAEGERDGWQQTALQHHRNEDYYRGIVDKILEPFGAAAHTSDDGSVQDSPLRAKAVELVDTMRTERDAALAELARLGADNADLRAAITLGVRVVQPKEGADDAKPSKGTVTENTELWEL